MTDLHEQSQTHNDGLLLMQGGKALMAGVWYEGEGKKKQANQKTSIEWLKWVPGQWLTADLYMCDISKQSLKPPPAQLSDAKETFILHLVLILLTLEMHLRQFPDALLLCSIWNGFYVKHGTFGKNDLTSVG